MFRETAAKTCEITYAELLRGNPQACIGAFAIDSRKVRSGDCFVAFKGERVDGNDYLISALDAGANVVVATQKPALDVIEAAERTHATLLYTPDAETFLQTLARWYRKQQSWFCVSVTGSCGKTTTKELLASIFSRAYKTYATAGNFNSTIGVPLTILQAPDDTEVFICEMGMNHAGEIDVIASCARPHIALITNIGTSHIGLLGSQEKIARAKAECVAWLANPLPSFISVEPTLIMPEDDAYTSFIQKHFAKPCGVELISVKVSDSTLSKEGNAQISIKDGEVSETIQLNLPGEAAAKDALLAYTAARVVGIKQHTIKAGLEATQPSSMRTHVVHSKSGVTIVDDSYNAAPASVMNALHLLQTLPAQRRIVVLGEMGELGDFAEEEHRKLAKELAHEKLDYVLFVGDKLAKQMLVAFDEKRAHYAKNYEEAFRKLKSELSENTAVLIKGSRFLELDKLVKEVEDIC